MKEETSSPSLRDWLGALNGAAATGVNVLAVGLSALLLSYAGTLSLALAPWSALAMPAGLALAAQWRWGRPVLLGVAVGTFAALLGSGMVAAAALMGAGVVVLAPCLAHALMGRLGFDARFERAVDVAILAVAVICGAALPGTESCCWFILRRCRRVGRTKMEKL